MRKNYLALLMLIPLLSGCSKTKELYKDYAYNSSNFMENFYVEQNDVDKLKVGSVAKYSFSKEDTKFNYTSSNSLEGIRPVDNANNYPWEDYRDYSNEFGRHNNLTAIDKSFAYGYLSKLYDGRVRCESKFQLSRVQLDKNGYSTFFPKKLESYKYFSFSLKGATDYYVDGKNAPIAGYDNHGVEKCFIDITIKFYKNKLNADDYDVIEFDLANVNIPCDAGSNTNLVTMYLDNNGINLVNTVAMSFSYTLKTTAPDLSDDSKADSKYHFAVRLYEVMFPQSTWL